MEIELSREGAEIGVRGRGSREERTPPFRLSAASAAALTQFGEDVRDAAMQRRPLDALLPRSQELHGAVFRDGVAALRASLKEASRGQPLLLRLALSDTTL